MTCQHCYQFKLRHVSGAGTCWQTHTHRDADDPICEEFTPKVIWVTPLPRST